jgi:hypothetical protein
VLFAVLDPDDPPQQGLLASRIVEIAAGHHGTGLVLLVAGRAAESLGVDAAFEARLLARKLDLPAEVVNPDAPHEVPGILSTDLEDRILAALWCCWEAPSHRMPAGGSPQSSPGPEWR